MKSTFGRFAAPLAVLLFLAVAPQVRPQQDKLQDPAPAAKTITGSGCVEAGVENRCIVLRDVKTKTLYNLIFSGKKPDVGTAIRFEGSKFDGATICMQGQAVKVSKWTPADIDCTPKKKYD
jgi:hypothetical protein